MIDVRMSKKVGFSDEDKTEKSLIVEKIASDLFKINLGMLKYNNIYRAEVFIPKTIAELLRGMQYVPNENATLCKLDAIEGTSVMKMTVEITACAKHVLEQQLSFNGLCGVVTFLFCARILGPDTGTPFLRNGVHLIGKQLRDNDSSDDD